MATLDKREEAERPQPKPASQVQNPRGDFFANMTSQQYRESQRRRKSLLIRLPVRVPYPRRRARR